MATEEPSFHLSFQEGAFEVRDYPSVIAAEVTAMGNRKAAGNAGFKLLAAYIFGDNARRLKMAMTAPVVQAQKPAQTVATTAPVLQTQASATENQAAWAIRFLMPRAYALTDLPTPNDKRVTLKAVPAQRYAVHRFSGFTGDTDVVKKTTELVAFTAARQLQVAGPPSLARYDPPWMPWFLRRNEVLIPLQPTPAL